MTDQPLSEAYVRLAELGLSLDVGRLCDIEGCWEHQIDDNWWVAANGHKVEQLCSRGLSVPPFNFLVMHGDWPAALINPYGGTMIGDDGTGEDDLIQAVLAATKTTENDNATDNTID